MYRSGSSAQASGSACRASVPSKPTHTATVARDGVKAPSPSEQQNIAVVRKSLVAACPIARGELFTPENLTVKRPGNGASPFRYWELLGSPAPRDYAEDDLIEA